MVGCGADALNTMKIITCILALAAFLFIGCNKPKSAPQPPKKVERLEDFEVPKDVPPPVETIPYEDGYKAGDAAGVAYSHEPRPPRTRAKLPSDDELAVLSLAAAGADPARGAKWQRGWESGFKDAYARIVERRR